MNETLFNRAGTERTPNSTTGKATFSYVGRCNRCGGQGWAEQWRHTGLKCYDCGGSGQGKVATEKLYTAEKLAKLNAAADKRSAIKAAARAAQEAAIQAERDARRAAFLVSEAATIARIDALASRDDFFAGFRESFIERAQAPTPRQIEVIDKAEARYAAKDAGRYVGKTGDRVILTIKAERVIDITIRESNGYAPYGLRLMYLCRDENGNRIVYRGNSHAMPDEGETVTIKATVAEHSEYQGEHQTMIQRPKAVEG